MLVSGDEGQVHFRGLRGGKLDLHLLSCFLQALKGQLVLGKVNAFLFLEAFGQIFDDLRIEVLAAQERVAVGRFNLENAIADFQDRNRSEEHTSELQSLMRISYAVFCLKKKNKTKNN